MNFASIMWDVLVIMANFWNFGLCIAISMKFGVYSGVALISVSSFAVLLFYSITTRVTRDEVMKALEERT